MKIVITGGNGFLGSNIVRRLLKEDHSVMVLSNNSNNIQDLLTKIQYKNLSSIEENIRSFSPDVLIHCAWSGGNNHRDVNSVSQFDNIPLGIGLINSIRNSNKKVKFIGFGSFSEYGILNYKAKEKDQENPINFYGLSKYTFKRCSKLLCEQYGIDWVWIRPCYVFGNGDVQSRLIPKLIDKFSKNEKVELDECKTMIDYIHIDDFSNLFYNLSVSNHQGVFNICSGREYELRSVIETIHSLTKSSSEVSYDNKLNKDSPKYICGDNKKVLDATKLSISCTLEEGILKTINNNA